MKHTAFEVNFDGIVGPTHNYSGLSYGNIASQKSRSMRSNPKEAALQGLEKMKSLSDLGVKQAVLPPHERPHLPTLRSLGFAGNDAAVIAAAAAKMPQLLSEVSSASAMWTANAATVCPSADAADGLVHLTVANLASKFHRSIEPPTTSAILRKIFHDGKLFQHHSPLPGGCQFGDEGAANHTRLCRSHKEPGIHLFVYGRKGLSSGQESPKRYPARQSLEASESIFRLHHLAEDAVVFAQQHPDAIDAGAFHNDVVAVGNENLLFFHEQAFLDKERVLKEIARKAEAGCGTKMTFLEVKKKQITLEEAIATYLFNSQVITLPDGAKLLLAPSECKENEKIHSYLKDLLSDQKGGIGRIEFVNLRQSMFNGGGPACLRLRIVLTERELAGMHQGVVLNDTLYPALKGWINQHYRDRLDPSELADPQLYLESCRALDELTQLLKIGSLYSFQKNKTAQ